MFTKRAFLALAGATLLATAPMQALAEGWKPRKPIDFVIMAGPGGGADQIARFVQSVVEANDMMNRPLVPTNRGGGSGAAPPGACIRRVSRSGSGATAPGAGWNTTSSPTATAAAPKKAAPAKKAPAKKSTAKKSTAKKSAAASQQGE